MSNIFSEIYQPINCTDIPRTLLSIRGVFMSKFKCSTERGWSVSKYLVGKIHYLDKYLYLSPLLWSKTTLIASRMK